MTSKDYEAIAAAIAETHDTVPVATLGDWSAFEDWSVSWHTALSVVTQKISEIAKAENPRFDIDRFFAACSKSSMTAR